MGHWWRCRCPPGRRGALKGTGNSVGHGKDGGIGAVPRDTGRHWKTLGDMGTLGTHCHCHCPLTAQIGPASLTTPRGAGRKHIRRALPTCLAPRPVLHQKPGRGQARTGRERTLPSAHAQAPIPGARGGAHACRALCPDWPGRAHAPGRPSSPRPRGGVCPAARLAIGGAGGCARGGRGGGRGRAMCAGRRRRAAVAAAGSAAPAVGSGAEPGRCSAFGASPAAASASPGVRQLAAPRCSPSGR